jgi:rRNA-processing protein CGR1
MVCLRLQFYHCQVCMLTWFSGKQWHAPKKAFRPASGLTSYEKRAQARIAQAATKAKEKELKEEKEAERQVRIAQGPTPWWSTTTER